MTKFIKNNTQSNKTWVGQLIEPSSYYEVQLTEDFQWANDATLLIAISNEDAVVAKTNNGTQDITNVNDAINYLKHIDDSPKDSDGSPIFRDKVTTTGWNYQLHGFEFETSKLDSFYSKKADNTDFAFGLMKFYKLDNGSEVEITGNDLNQNFLDTNCIKTTVDWEPNHDYDVIGGMLKQTSIPNINIRMWTVGVPDYSEAYQGSKLFASSVNLKYIGIEEGVRVDGRASKTLVYMKNGYPNTNKLRLIFRHDAGIKHPLMMVFEIFKP